MKVVVVRTTHGSLLKEVGRAMMNDLHSSEVFDFAIVHVSSNSKLV